MNGDLYNVNGQLLPLEAARALKARLAKQDSPKSEAKPKVEPKVEKKITEPVTAKVMTIEEAREAFEVKLGKPVANAYKNNIEWILSKLK